MYCGNIVAEKTIYMLYFIYKFMHRLTYRVYRDVRLYQKRDIAIDDRMRKDER